MRSRKIEEYSWAYARRWQSVKDELLGKIPLSDI